MQNMYRLPFVMAIVKEGKQLTLIRMLLPCPLYYLLTLLYYLPYYLLTLFMIHDPTCYSPCCIIYPIIYSLCFLFTHSVYDL